MKQGDVITCRDEKDLKQTLRDLSLAGFHAVHDSGTGHNLRITGVPETEYLVEAWNQSGRLQRAYCADLEEAEEIASELRKAYLFVEILSGYPGEYETVSRNWGKEVKL